MEDEVESLRDWLIGVGLLSAEAAEFSAALVRKQRIGSVPKMQYLLSTAKLADRLAEVGMDQDNIGLVLQALKDATSASAGGGKIMSPDKNALPTAEVAANKNEVFKYL